MRVWRSRWWGWPIWRSADFLEDPQLGHVVIIFGSVPVGSQEGKFKSGNFNHGPTVPQRMGKLTGLPEVMTSVVRRETGAETSLQL